MLRSLSLTAAAAILAGPAMADGINYALIGYNYTNISADGVEDLNMGDLQGAVEYEFSQFLLSADVRHVNVEVDSESSSATVYAFGAAYMLSPEALVGLEVLGVEPEDGDSTTGYGVFGQLQTAQYALGVHVSQQDSDQDNITTNIYGEFVTSDALTLGVQVNSESEFDGTTSYFSADYEQGAIEARTFIISNNEVDGGLFGLSASYQFSAQFRVSAAYQTLYGEDTDDADAFSVGGGYQITDGMWIDASYGQIGGDTYIDGIEIIQASLTYELGDRKRLDRRFAQAAIDDTRATGLVSVLNTQ